MSAYSLKPSFFAHEDILICVDTDPILDRPADLATFGYGVICNIDCIQMALFFFVQAKLSINPDHRFAFCTLSQSSISWVQREFSSELDLAIHAIDDISPDSFSDEHGDLTQLFQVAAVEATRCNTESRILRVSAGNTGVHILASRRRFEGRAYEIHLDFDYNLALTGVPPLDLPSGLPSNQSATSVLSLINKQQILIYCRSWVLPEHHWPVDQNLFTLDVVFLREDLHAERSWNNVYDALVNAIGDISVSRVLSDHRWLENRNLFPWDIRFLLDNLNVEYRRNNVYGALVDVVGDISKYEGYVIRCLHGLVYALLRHMCVLLLHPQQRRAQDEIDIPRSLTKKSPTP